MKFTLKLGIEQGWQQGVHDFICYICGFMNFTTKLSIEHGWQQGAQAKCYFFPKIFEATRRILPQLSVAP